MKLLPRTMGSFVILITVLSFTAGMLRNELALTLLGTVFLVTLAYCFLGVLLSGVIYRRKGQSLSIAISSQSVSVGREGELCIKTGSGILPERNYFLRLPAILIRCELSLGTRDGRVIRHFVNPGYENLSLFPVTERGAYFSNPGSGECDRLVIFDAPGFFRFSLPLFQDEGVRLLAVPGPAEESVLFSLKSGGTEERSEAHYRKSDALTDHRPYVPGDDPRRINWKLYGHAPMGELFVREGEPEPPPHSRLFILVDTETDSFLHSPEEGRRGIDLLCENALAAALEYSGKGTDILVGYTGGGNIDEKDESPPLNAAELARALAWPYAISRPSLDLPEVSGGRAVIILALPRAIAFDPSAAGKPGAEASALDRFLKKHEARQKTNIVFLYDAESKRAAELEAAARACVNFYNGKAGLAAQKFAVPSGRGPE